MMPFRQVHPMSLPQICGDREQVRRVPNIRQLPQRVPLRYLPTADQVSGYCQRPINEVGIQSDCSPTGPASGLPREPLTRDVGFEARARLARTTVIGRTAPIRPIGKQGRLRVNPSRPERIPHRRILHRLIGVVHAP